MPNFARSGLPVLALAGLIALSACKPAPAPEATPQRTVFAPPDGARTLAHAQAPMRDGVRLDATVYLPAATGGPWPTVLIRTPYRTELDGRYASEFFQRLLSEGYAIAQVHERGRYLSEGEMRMLGRADEDGWDTLSWIAAQPWSDGKVATYGCSSSAENQMKLASLGHPAHKAMIAYSAGVGVAEAGPFREQGNFWRGGAWQMGWFNYFVEEMQVDWPQLPAGLSDAERQRASAAFTIDNTGSPFEQKAFAKARLHLPMAEMGESMGAPQTEVAEYLARGPSHPAWAEDRSTDADHIKVPGLWAEALYDISAQPTVALFDRARAESAPGTQAIVITNGRHCAYGRESEKHLIGDRDLGDARFDYHAREIAWLDRWLKGKTEAPAPAKPVRVYMAGAKRWADFDAVPSAAAGPSRTFFLSSAGKANTLTGDGRLADAAPTAEAADSLRYDPADPVIAHGGQISGMGPEQEDGAFDQRDIESREDVLVYTSEPLEQDLAVFGYVDVELAVASDAPDTDFTVKLVDVAPDGTAWNLSDSIQRMRYRNGEAKPEMMTPGAVYRIAPPPMLVANVFLKGHRVRLEVSSSNFPSYARNLNTAGDPYTTTETRIANNRVLHGPANVSKLALPIVVLSAVTVSALTPP